MPSTATAGMTSFISFACSSATTGPATNAGTPLFQAFSPIPAWESTDGDCIKVGVKRDPACGTSGFLISAGEYLKVNHKKEIFYDKAKKDHYMNHMFYGYDTDRTMLRIGAMNMMTHGVDNPFIEYRDSLSDQNQDKGV